MKLFFPKPAKDENEATPLGNGHIGLWAYRGGEKETVHLNEATFWSGYYKEPSKEGYFERLSACRDLLLKNKFKEAEKAMLKGGKRINSEEYDPIGDLIIMTPGEKPRGGTLDMSKAVLTVKGEIFSRAYFVSYPDKVFVIRMEAEKPSDISFGFLKKNEGETEITDSGIIACGKAIHDGMAFCFDMRVLCDVPGQTIGHELVFKHASDLTVIGTIKTGFTAWDKEPIKEYAPLKEAAEEIVEAAIKKGSSRLYTDHVEDYATLFERNELIFGKEESTISPSEELKKKVPSSALVTAYYAFSKYLTISASRKDSPAMNLQGIWNKNIHPAWRSNYTININTEMNYWFADCADLSECFLPFEELVNKLSVRGESVAKMLGADSFCSFHNADIWGFCASVDEMMCYSFFPLAGVWMTCELMNHYRYTQDKEYLARIYPIVKKSCDFVLSFLVEKDGELVTAPSTSPEHRYKMFFRKNPALTVASTCDMFLINQLFDDLIECSSLLNVDEEYAIKIAETKKKLHKPTIDKLGRLDEFHPGVKECEKGHRHFSHLIGAFPLQQVGYYENKEYISAVKNSLDYRLKHGSGYTGWSCGWALNLLEKTHESELFSVYLGKLFNDSTYPNMLDRHPPFQIDGNFGAGRAFAGMVATSEGNVIELFPVRIPQNASGRVKNLCLAGGYKITMEWENHVVKKLFVYSETAKAVSFRNQDDGTAPTYPVHPGEYTEITLRTHNA
ncbi:MAG: glycoside hydrolase N-terminal domain-containing protein [Clostridia bacterium]|nr:glycoside hydrolase N-terminal domain-containing protein [Clostridia bacterium]